MRTPIAYYGGKQMMVPFILPIIPKHTVYTEVFCGGAAVFWAKQPSAIETINDINGMVVNFYEVLKLKYAELKPLIEATLVCRDQWRRATDIYKNLCDATDVQKAWAFWFSCNYSFATKPTAGLRYSNHQWFSTPGLLKRNKKEFTEYLVARIENATIENKDACVVLKSRNIPDAFHYLDPPYPETDQGHYSGYTLDQFIELLEVIRELRGKFMLSSFHYPVLTEYCKANGWFQLEYERKAYANTGVSKSKSIKTEVLTLNYTPENKQADLFHSHIGTSAHHQISTPLAL